MYCKESSGMIIVLFTWCLGCNALNVGSVLDVVFWM